MRTKNIKVTFEIPIPVNERDLNGVIFSKEAIEKAYKDAIKDIPIGVYDRDNNFIPVGNVHDTELLEDYRGNMCWKVSGIIFYGGTEEFIGELNYNNSQREVTDFRVTSIGICQD